MRPVSATYVFLLLSSTTLASTYIVHPDGTGDFPTIQAAIDACVDGDVVELTDGRFHGSGNRNIDYLGKAITVRSQSGNPDACYIDLEQDESATGFRFANGEGAASVLSGIAVENAPFMFPLVLTILNASPTFRHCSLRGYCDVTADPPGSVCSPTFERSLFPGAYLAAVVLHHASGTFTDCSFATLVAGTGPQSTTTLVNCEIYGSVRQREGRLVATECAFVGSYPLNYGILCIEVMGTAEITRCVFSENYGGTGLEFVPVVEVEGDAKITDCLFADNYVCGHLVEARGGSSGGQLTVSGCTFVNNQDHPTYPHEAIGTATRATISRTLIAANVCGSVKCLSGGTATLRCCDIYGNEGGDWVGCIADQYGVNGNVSADPLFCDMAGGDYSIDAASPCAPDSSSGCGLIGALEVGCGVSVVEATTWGRIKASFQ